MKRNLTYAELNHGMLLVTKDKRRFLILEKDSNLFKIMNTETGVISKFVQPFYDDKTQISEQGMKIRYNQKPLKYYQDNFPEFFIGI